MCSELSAIDYLKERGEFEIFYQLLNLDDAKRVRVILPLKDGESIQTIVPVFAMANFAEREMYDMFGIFVNGHPYLKRLLMPEDWQGYPLRKSYPLQGDEFAAWYEIDKIFGKEYRDIVGPEIRDPARIDRSDTQRYSRVGHEVPFGADMDEKGDEVTSIEYSENFMVNYNKSSKMLDKRK
jgi:NADH-quinone oxidoreductase subunit C